MTSEVNEEAEPGLRCLARSAGPRLRPDPASRGCWASCASRSSRRSSAPGVYADAFQIAFRIPNLLRDLFAEGALSAAFVPDLRARCWPGRTGRGAHRLASRLLHPAGRRPGRVVLLGVVFARAARARRWRPGFDAVPGKAELTVAPDARHDAVPAPRLLRGRGHGHAERRGAVRLPGVRPGDVQRRHDRLGPSLLVGLGFGPDAGRARLGRRARCSAAPRSSSIQVPPLCEDGLALPAGVGARRSRASAQIGRLMAPATVGLAAVQVNIFVNSYLRLPRAGRGLLAELRLPHPVPAHRHLRRRRRARWPRRGLARRAAAGDMDGPARDPAPVALDARVPDHPRHRRASWCWPSPSCASSTSAGASDAAATAGTAAALALYALGLVAYTAVKVLAPAFYALGTPARAAPGQRPRGGDEPAREPRSSTARSASAPSPSARPRLARQRRRAGPRLRAARRAAPTAMAWRALRPDGRGGRWLMAPRGLAAASALARARSGATASPRTALAGLVPVAVGVVAYGVAGPPPPAPGGAVPGRRSSATGVAATASEHPRSRSRPALGPKVLWVSGFRANLRACRPFPNPRGPMKQSRILVSGRWTAWRPCWSPEAVLAQASPGPEHYHLRLEGRAPGAQRSRARSRRASARSAGTLLDLQDDLGRRRTSGPTTGDVTIQFKQGIKLRGSYTPIDYTGDTSAPARTSTSATTTISSGDRVVTTIQGRLLHGRPRVGLREEAAGLPGRLRRGQDPRRSTPCSSSPGTNKRERGERRRPACPCSGFATRVYAGRRFSARGRVLGPDHREARAACWEFDGVRPFPPLGPAGRHGRLPVPAHARQAHERARLRRGQAQRLAVRPRAQPLGTRMARAARAPSSTSTSTTCGSSAASPTNTLLAYGRDLRAPRRLRRGAAASLLDLAPGRPHRLHRQPRASAGLVRALGGARRPRRARGFFRFAVREGRLEPTPWRTCARRAPSRRLPRYLTPAQVEALLAAPDAADAARPARPRDPRGPLRHGPARLRARSGLRPADLDLEVGLLTLLRQGPQGAPRPARARPRGAGCERYLDDARPGSGAARRRPTLFLNHRGRPALAHGPLGHRAPARGHRGGRARC